MKVPVPVVSVDLAGGIEDLHLGDCSLAHVLVRFRGRALVRYEVPVTNGVLRGVDIWTQVCNGVRAGSASGLPWLVFDALVRERVFGQALEAEPQLPPCTILVCTRDRSEDLHRCLTALEPVIGDDVELIVVDNDPPDERTRQVAEKFPVRYYRQSRRGVNWARARGAMLARHEVVLYVDDDVVVDRNWVNEMRKPFLDQHVGAVTGAIEPLELETEGQYLHEVFSSFYRGFERRVHNVLTGSPASAGRVGAGASMGVRKSLAMRHTIFDAELDGGTAAKSGGDVYGLYRILRAGYSIVYAPAALAWHRHRKTHEALERMLYGYSVGAYCVLMSAFFREKDWDAPLIGVRWFFEYHLAELWNTLRRRQGARPLSLILLEIKGAFDAPLAYWRCRRRERTLGSLTEESLDQALVQNS